MDQLIRGRANRRGVYQWDPWEMGRTPLELAYSQGRGPIYNRNPPMSQNDKFRLYWPPGEEAKTVCISKSRTIPYTVIQYRPSSGGEVRGGAVAPGGHLQGRHFLAVNNLIVNSCIMWSSLKLPSRTRSTLSAPNSLNVVWRPSSVNRG